MNDIIKRVSLTVFFCLTVFGLPLNAQNTNNDSVKFSLLTCEPGEIIYTLFGHTAIRYQNPAQNIDIVYNYGLFSFSDPIFIWWFVKGETDYCLGDTTFQRFAAGYHFDNRAVWEQELNLTADEKQRLLQRLQINNLPENRMYRYNFLFDNCSTRARDIIEQSIDGKVIYQEFNYRQSFRDIISKSTMGYDWSRFGMDFCLGVDVDKPITFREEMFAPDYLMNAFENAIITGSNGDRPLVKSVRKIVNPPENAQSGSYLITPIRAFLLLFMIIAGLTIYGIKKRKSLWGVDIVLFAAAGIAGCIVAFLTFFSEHPAVSPNYLIFAFHPLHLLLLPFFIRKEIKGKRSIYHILNTAILTLFILLWAVIPQHFNAAVLPLALCLLVRSASNLVLTYKPNK